MTAQYVHDHILPAAFACLPPQMNTPRARALVLAIGLQESRFTARRQLRRGPARGFWQFELGGSVVGVLTHRATRPYIERLLEAFGYPPSAHACYEAIEHNDVLAALFARLNLWWLPGTLADEHEVDKAWQQYLDAWRPGAPHPETWPAFYAQAWAIVRGGPVPVARALAA